MAASAKRGIDLLQDPSLNTAFTEDERKALGIGGLVPDVIETEDLQLQRVMLQLAQKNTDLERPSDMVALIRERVYRPEYEEEAIQTGKAA